MTQRQLERRLHYLTVYAVGSTVMFILLFLTAFATTQRERFEVIDVERINVVEPNGQLALVISNGARVPGPVIGGEELPKELSSGRDGAVGITFYNAKGDEAGGLIYRSQESDSSYAATGLLAFDQYNQDQVVAVMYDDDSSTRAAGLNVWDRSTEFTISDIVDLVQARQQATGAARDSIEQQLAQAAARGDLGVRRIFVGSEDRRASVRISDTAGKERIRMYVDSSDAARLEFLDAEGNVVSAWPE